MKHNLYPLFASNVSVFEIEVDYKKYISELEKEPYEETNINNPNNSFISSNNKILDKSKFKDLKNKIIDCFETYNEYMQYSCNVEMYNSWATKTDLNQESEFHNHSNSLVSGVFYLQDDMSNICFENFNKPHFSVPFTKSNIYNSQSYYFTPKPGMLLLFPSMLYHKIIKNNKGIRYSIAFNFIPKGKIGTIDNELIL